MKTPVLPDLFSVPVEPLLISGREADTFRTSRAAAISNQDTKAQQQAQVYACIQAAGDQGRTDDEIQAILGLDGSSVRPRRCELWRADKIKVSGRTRKTRRGRLAVVWVVS